MNSVLLFLCNNCLAFTPSVTILSKRCNALVRSLFKSTSFPGSLFSASLGRWKKDPGCGWSHDQTESGWQKNLLGGRGGRAFCLVDVTNCTLLVTCDHACFLFLERREKNTPDTFI